MKTDLPELSLGWAEGEEDLLSTDFHRFLEHFELWEGRSVSSRERV